MSQDQSVHSLETQAETRPQVELDHSTDPEMEGTRADVGLEEPSSLKFDLNWSIKNPYRTHIPKDGDHWKACFTDFLKLDEEMCRGWRDELDTMLIFAGLFSATVTAFVVESYQWLQNSDTPSDILARLQLQQMFNGTLPTEPNALPTIGSTSAVTINALWFSSLTLALGSAVVGILCKQWLREYLRYEPAVEAKHLFAIREMRYKGLQGWHVRGIITSLPLLLQVALALFFIGILVLLWSLQRTVAAIVTVIVGTTLIFLIATSLLPVIQWRLLNFKTQCAFKSPQSWFLILATFHHNVTWTHYDRRMSQQSISKYPLSSLKRFYNYFSQNVEAVRNVYHCISDPKSGVAASDFVTIFPDVVSWAIDSLSSPGLGLSTDIDKKDIEEDIALALFSSKLAMGDLPMFHRNAEHCARILDDRRLVLDPDFSASTLQVLSESIRSATVVSNLLDWNTVVASQLISILSSMFRRDHMPDQSGLGLWNDILPSLWSYGSRYPEVLDSSPYSLLDDIGPWLLRHPDGEVRKMRVEHCMYGLRKIVVTGQVDRMSSGQLQKVKSLFPIIRSEYSDPNSELLDVFRKFFDISTVLRPPLYRIRHVNTLRYIPNSIT